MARGAGRSLVLGVAALTSAFAVGHEPRPQARELPPVAYVELVADGWTRTRAELVDLGPPETYHLYQRVGADGMPIATLGLSDRRPDDPPDDAGDTVLADGTRIHGDIRGLDGLEDKRELVVVRAGCPPTRVWTFGFREDEVRAALGSLRCTEPLPRLTPPPGTEERTVSEPGPRMVTFLQTWCGPPDPTTGTRPTVVMYAWADYVRPETFAEPGTRLVVRDGRRMVLDTRHKAPEAAIRDAGAFVMLKGLGLGADGLVDVATRIRPGDPRRLFALVEDPLVLTRGTPS